MKLLRIYKENKALIKENTELKTKLKSEEEQNMNWITKYSLLREKLTENQMKTVNLQSELREERVKNIELLDDINKLLKKEEKKNERYN